MRFTCPCGFFNFSTDLAHCPLISGWCLGWCAAGTENETEENTKQFISHCHVLTLPIRVRRIAISTSTSNLCSSRLHFLLRTENTDLDSPGGSIDGVSEGGELSVRVSQGGTKGSRVFPIVLFEDLSDNPLRMTVRRFSRRPTLSAHPNHSTLIIQH